MGAAKSRGDFEKRKADAVERNRRIDEFIKLAKKNDENSPRVNYKPKTSAALLAYALSMQQEFQRR